MRRRLASLARVTLLALPAALATLSGCSDLAAQTPSPTAYESYRFTWTRSVRPEIDGSKEFLREVERKLWVGPDGAGRVATRQGTPIPISDAGTPWTGRGLGPWKIDDYEPGELTYLSLDGLESPESVAIAQSSLGPVTPGQQFQWVRDRLHETAPPKAAIVALMTKLSNIAGVRSEPAVDALGRAGTAYGMTTGTTGRIANRILVSDDFGLLEETRTLLDGAEGWPDPPVTLLATQYVDSRIVDAIGTP